ncbi:MAG: hypothetical protein ACO1SV_19010 [Fimbriimonas sp.]
MKKRARVGLYVPLLMAYFASLRYWANPASLVAATALLLVVMAVINARTERLPQ